MMLLKTSLWKVSWTNHTAGNPFHTPWKTELEHLSGSAYGAEFLNSYHSLCTWKIRTVLWFLVLLVSLCSPSHGILWGMPEAWHTQSSGPLKTATQRDCLLPSASLTLVLTKIESFGFCQGVVNRFSPSQKKSSSVPSLQLPLQCLWIPKHEPDEPLRGCGQHRGGMARGCGVPDACRGGFLCPLELGMAVTAQVCGRCSSSPSRRPQKQRLCFFHGKPPLLMASQALLSTPCKGLPQAPEICHSK